MSSNFIAGTSKITDDYQMTNDMLRKELFSKVMKGEWEEVVDIHKKDRRAYKTRITNSGQTALHIAIFQVRKDIVRKLVSQLIKKRDHKNDNDIDDHLASEAKEILAIKDNGGQKSLHMAAATGSTTMCSCIVDVDKSLVLSHNRKGETPLFRAVVYCRWRAFFCLHSIVFGDDRSTVDLKRCCCRDDGQTILHSAIFSENFELINYADKEGELPVHVLARKSASFRSGTILRGRDKIIYKCVSVKELEVGYRTLERYKDPKLGPEDRKLPNPPQNKRRTFLDSIGVMWRTVTRHVHVERELSANLDIETREGGLDQTGSKIADQERQRCFSSCCFEYFVKLVLPVVIGYGHASIKKIRTMKQKHVWAVQLLDELLKHATMYEGTEEYLASTQIRSKGQTKTNLDDNHSDDQDPGDQDISDEEYGDNKYESGEIFEPPETAGKEECSGKETKDTPILLAAKYGVTEMVAKILERFPVAIYDKDKGGKSVLFVAVENRNLQLYKILISRYCHKDCVFQKGDNKGNTALHYAAMYTEDIKAWPVPGAALQMQWEIKWHEFVENTMPPRLYLQTNIEGQTPQEIFSHTHKKLVEAGGKWLTSTANSCSIVATLIATVAFASSTTAPGGTNSENDKSVLQRSFTFGLFAISSLVALCCSVTSLILFLAILTSRHQEKDFGKDLPRKILLGLTSLFVSIASMLVMFCAGHSVVFQDKVRYAAFPVYAVTLFPLCLFAAAQCPLYVDLLLSTFRSPFSISRVLVEV